MEGIYKKARFVLRAKTGQKKKNKKPPKLDIKSNALLTFDGVRLGQLRAVFN